MHTAVWTVNDDSAQIAKMILSIKSYITKNSQSDILIITNDIKNVIEALNNKGIFSEKIVVFDIRELLNLDNKSIVLKLFIIIF